MRPSTSASLMESAESAARSGSPMDALRHAGELLRVVPLDHRARLAVARALAALGHTDRALHAYRTAAALVADRGFVLQAIAALGEALGLAPDDIDLVDSLSALHAKVHGLPAGGRAPALPPEAPVEIPEGGGSLLKYLDEDALVARAFELATSMPRGGASVEPSAVPLFSELSREVFLSVVSELVHHRVAAGATIVEQGAPGNALFVLVSGEVAVARDGEELARLPAGSIFGEMALVTEQTRAASVRATTDAELLELGVEQIERVAESAPEITSELVGFARRRMLLNVLGTSALFAPLPEAERPGLLASFGARLVADGERIIEEGEVPSALYVVASGAVEIGKRGEDGSVRRVAELGVGEVFGEIALVRETKTIASATAIGKTVLLALPKAKFAEVVARHPALGDYLSRLSTARSMETEELMGLEEADLDASELVLL